MLVEKLVKSGTACTNDNVNFLGFIFILSYFIFETCWAQICYVVEEDLEFLTLLSLLPSAGNFPSSIVLWLYNSGSWVGAQKTPMLFLTFL